MLALVVHLAKTGCAQVQLYPGLVVAQDTHAVHVERTRIVPSGHAWFTEPALVKGVQPALLGRLQWTLDDARVLLCLDTGPCVLHRFVLRPDSGWHWHDATALVPPANVEHTTVISDMFIDRGGRLYLALRTRALRPFICVFGSPVGGQVPLPAELCGKRMEWLPNLPADEAT